MKNCSICKLSKAIQEFAVRELKGDGYSAHCKVCAKTIYNNWKLRNLVKYNESQRIYRQERFKVDLNFKLKSALRSRLSKALRGNYKGGSAVRDLGCTILELRGYLESKFQFGMTWDNYGKTGWHIDHIVPLHSFDLSDSSQVRQACHYTNLQPLWAADNIRKGSQEHVKMNENNKIKGRTC